MAASSFYSPEELRELGLLRFGENVLLSRFARLYSPETIEIGDHVRIDDFCILSGRITLGSRIHISAYTALYGAAGITLEDFTTVSGRTLIYSVSDDYSGDTLTNPMIPDQYRNVTQAPVRLGQFAIIGAGSVVLPGVTIHEGAAIGAMSLVRTDAAEWTIYAGVPARRIGERHRNLLWLAKDLETAHRLAPDHP
jgi:acetyltransferase-like isoleucine patch superfamily enzyme